MDRSQFDALSRLVATKQSRRAAMATTLGAALLGHNAPAAVAKGKKKKDKGQRPCFPGRTCIPGPGKDNAGCDFSLSLRLHRQDARGAHLGGANLAGAYLVGADLRGADLGGACLAGADLRDAAIDGSTNVKHAIFCGTLMPDGAVNNADCDRTTRCCPATLHQLPGWGDRGVGFKSIKNNSHDHTFQLDVWYLPSGNIHPEDYYWHHDGPHFLTAGDTYESRVIWRFQAIYIDNTYWAYIANPGIGDPLGQLGYGGTISRDKWTGWTIVQDRSMPTTGTQLDMIRDNVIMRLRKEDDDSNNILWSLQLQTLSGDPG